MRPSHEAATLAQTDGITAMMDISDGLLLDASRIAACSRVYRYRQPVCSGVRSSAISHDNTYLAMTGGEDYVLLFTCATDVELPSWAVPVGLCGLGQGVTVEAVVDPATTILVR